MKRYINLLLLVICMELILPLPLYTDAMRTAGIDEYRPLVFLVSLIFVSLLVTLLLRVQVREKTEELQRINQDLRKQLTDLQTKSFTRLKPIRPESICLATQTAHEQEALLHSLKNTANSILALNEEITDGAQIESSADQLESIPFSLRNCLEKTILNFTRAAESSGLKMTARIEDNVPDSLVGDPDRLRQLVVCMLAHALKFTGRGHVGFSIQAQSTHSDRVSLQFIVSDTGQGISAKSNDNSPAPVSLEPSSSAWLELSLAAELVRRMNGQIQIQSPSDLADGQAGGPGTALYVTLAFAETRKSPSVPPS